MPSKLITVIAVVVNLSLTACANSDYFEATSLVNADNAVVYIYRPAATNPGKKPLVTSYPEITVDGKKLVGSAQKRTSRSFLQHGSLIIESDHKLFTSLLKFDDESERVALQDHLMKSTTTMNQACGRKISFEEISTALEEGFRKTLGTACLNY